MQKWVIKCIDKNGAGEKNKILLDQKNQTHLLEIQEQRPYPQFGIVLCILKQAPIIRIQLLLNDNTWSTRYTIRKIDRYSNLSTDWTMVSILFTVLTYGTELIYDEIVIALADM